MLNVLFDVANKRVLLETKGFIFLELIKEMFVMVLAFFSC